ncbi:MAG TPA: ADP-glyceromanno-heptose 6-epimerase [Rhabdochlamydiaceae bacterium]|nr:ADP-glyceromanno-heptose 6-epimerase [Rhabdochlamydiaceae bacterium]
MNAIKNKTIIITGAAGFIGSAVVRHLNDQGVTNLLLVDDIKKTQKWKNLLNKNFADFISKHALFEWLQGKQNEISAFIHLGACSDTLEMDGDYLMENNYRYTVKLAEYALKHGYRFIYASSAATYGDGRLGFSDHHDLLDELQPLNLYGYSKHLFDMWAKHHGILDQVTGLKYFNVFGPNESHKGRMSSFVYQKFPSASDSQPIKLFKSTEPERFPDGGQQRDFIYVKDVAKMTCDFLTNNHTGIYNIGSGEATTWNHLASSLYKALDKPAQIEYMDMPADLAKQYQNYTCADMTKYCTTHEYGSPVPNLQFNVEEGVVDYVRNHLLKAERW